MKRGLYTTGISAKQEIILDGSHASVSAIINFLAYGIKSLLHALDESFSRDRVGNFEASRPEA